MFRWLKVVVLIVLVFPNLASGEEPTPEARLEALVKKADAKRAEGLAGPAAALYAKALEHAGQSFSNPDEDVLYWVTRAHFGKTELDLAEWREIALEGELKALKKRIELRKAGMTELGAEYQKLLSAPQMEWKAAGLCRMGNLFQDFGEALMTAPCPGSFDAETCDAFVANMEVAAGEMEDEALQYYGALNDIMGEADAATLVWKRCAETGLATLQPAPSGP